MEETCFNSEIYVLAFHLNTNSYVNSDGSSACRPLQVKIAYVNFVNHCYVDTEVEMKEIYTSNHIWNLFENFLVDMAKVRTPAWL